MILQIALQIILPAFLIVGLWRATFTSRLEWLLQVLAFCAILLFVFLTARWDFTSYYFRYLLPALLAPAAYLSYRRTIQFQTTRRKPRLIAVGTSVAIFLCFSGLSGMVLWAYKAPPGALQLGYPLRGAVYYVGGGGNHRLINNHQVHEPQKFALDIVRLNAFGNRASGLAPEDAEKYAIFGDTVYSPCSGTVTRAVDGLPDLRPSETDTDNLAGNYIVIEHDGVKVILAHLKEGSVAVKAGMRVKQGDRLGQIGNSGNSSQPHLHLHAERGGEPGEILVGEAVPITLGERFLVRNSLFNGR